MQGKGCNGWLLVLHLDKSDLDLSFDVNRDGAIVKHLKIIGDSSAEVDAIKSMILSEKLEDEEANWKRTMTAEDFEAAQQLKTDFTNQELTEKGFRVRLTMILTKYFGIPLFTGKATSETLNATEIVAKNAASESASSSAPSIADGRNAAETVAQNAHSETIRRNATETVTHDVTSKVVGRNSTETVPHDATSVIKKKMWTNIRIVPIKIS